MIEHATAYDLLALAAVHALDPSEQQQVEEHMRHCESCRTEFDGWIRIIDDLKLLRAPQPSPKLAPRTRRLLEAFAAGRQANQVLTVFLVLFCWIITVLNWFLVRLFDIPLARWLDVSSATVWIVYIGTAWLATALAAALLGKHWQQEGKTI
jgi:predicted anti-sigma-YlaC factor YlaD